MNLAFMTIVGDLLWWLANHLPFIRHIFYWILYESPGLIYVPIHWMWRLITLPFRII